MYNKLITLGCSITHHHGWANFVSTALKIPLVNLSESSGTNFLQCKRFQELAFKQNIANNDIIIWQITSVERSFARKKENNYIDNNDQSISAVKSVNIFDNMPRIDFLSHSSVALSSNSSQDYPQLIEDLLFYIISAKKFTPNVFVVYGWEGVMSKEYKTIFENHLSLYNITLIKEPIVNWCSNKNLSFHSDNLHPTGEAYYSYSIDYLLPVLSRYLNLTKEEESK